MTARAGRGGREPVDLLARIDRLRVLQAEQQARRPKFKTVYVGMPAVPTESTNT